MLGKNRKGKNQKSAFTLIELLISLSILGIMAAMSIGAYPRFSEQLTVTTETYKMLAYMRETQTYGISAVSTPGVKFVYSFVLNKSDSSLKRYQLDSPTGSDNQYYVNSSILDTTASVNTMRAQFYISDINGISNNATTSLDKAYAFFKRPNPEARLVGLVGTNISPDTNTKSFDRIEVVVKSRNNSTFSKKLVILATRQR